MTATITFAIPYYKGLDYLDEAIQSVFAQSFTNWELLIINDSSPEPGWAEFVQERKELNIRWLENPRNLGMAGTWNRCIEESRTEYVTLLHSDDRLLPNYAEEMTKTLGNHPQAAAAFCGTEIIDENGRRAFSFPDWYKERILLSGSPDELVLKGEEAMSHLIEGNFIFCPTLCFRKSAIQGFQFSPEYKMVLDFDLIARLLMSGKSLIGRPHVKGYAYRRHRENATTEYTTSLLRFREESEFFDRVRDRSRSIGWPQAARLASGKQILKKNLAFCILTDLIKLRLRGARKKGGALYRLLTGSPISS